MSLLHYIFLLRGKEAVMPLASILPHMVPLAGLALLLAALGVAQSKPCGLCSQGFDRSRPPSSVQRVVMPDWRQADHVFAPSSFSVERLAVLGASQSRLCVLSWQGFDRSLLTSLAR